MTEGQMTDVDMSTEARVERGIALFDAKGPADWRDRIDADEVDVESIYDCPLGQVFGGAGFIRGCEALGILIERAPIYGFERDFTYPDPLADIQGLTNEWYRRLA